MAKILVAEDDTHLCRAYENKLRLDGFDVVLAYNGEEAIELILKEKPDLILLDILMPKKDGFDVNAEIKKHDETKDIPVIFLTNFGQSFLKERATYDGADEFFVKSNTPITKLMDTIRGILRGEIKPGIKLEEPETRALMEIVRKA